MTPTTIRRAAALGVVALVAPALGCVPPPGDARERLAALEPIELVGGDAALAGSETTTCTHQEPPSGNGDRWCAFTRPTADAALVELWVVDVSAAARGAAPACDGSDPRCLRLTSTAPTRTPSTFDGDTLVVYADAASAPGDAYLGPIGAWRPGWPRARTISSARGTTCAGHAHAAVAVCLDDPPPDSTSGGADATRVQLRAGALDSADGGPLPALDGTWPFADQSSSWQADFSPDGATFAFSGPDAPGGAPSLRVVPTRDVGARAPISILDGTLDWRITNDGAHVTFVRRTDVGGALWEADFPSGAHAVMISPRIEDYWLEGARPTDHGLVVFEKRSDVETAFELGLDDMPARAPLTVFTYDDVIDDWAVSADLRYTAWTDASFAGRVVRNADLAACVVNPADATPIYKPAFLDDASTIFWKELSPSDGSSNAYYAKPEACGDKHLFASGVGTFTPIGAGGLVFDTSEGAAGTSTLHVAAVDGGGDTWPEAAVRVQGGVEAAAALVGSSGPLLVYRSNGDGAREAGLFVFGPLPF